MLKYGRLGCFEYNGALMTEGVYQNSYPIKGSEKVAGVLRSKPRFGQRVIKRFSSVAPEMTVIIVVIRPNFLSSRNGHNNASAVGECWEHGSQKNNFVLNMFNHVE